MPPRLIAIEERLRTHFQSLDEPIRPVEQEIVQQPQEDERSQRLLGIPGIGPITASRIAIELGDAQQFTHAQPLDALGE